MRKVAPSAKGDKHNLVAQTGSPGKRQDGVHTHCPQERALTRHIGAAHDQHAQIAIKANIVRHAL